MAYNIRERRTELGLTLADVANAVGVSKGTVSKWESGKTQNMRADNAYNLANILGVSVIEILSGEEMQKFQGKAFSPQAAPPKGGKTARQSPNVQPLIFKDCVCAYRSKKPHINQDLFKGTNAGIYNPTGKPLSKDSLFANSDYSWQIEALNMSDSDINTDEMRDSTAAVYGGSKASPKVYGDYATLMLLKDGCEPIIVKLSENGFSQIVSTINAIKHNGSK